MERLFTSVKHFCRSDSEKTTKSYKGAMVQFGQSKFGNLPEEDLFSRLDQYIRTATRQDVLDDLRNFKVFLDDLKITRKIGGQEIQKKYEIKTKMLRIAIVQAWFMRNEIGLPKAYQGEFSYKEKPETDDVAFTPETALSVYHQLKSPIARCVFVFLLVTGCRIREATCVRTWEVTWDYKLPDGSRGPVRIRFDGSYTKNGKSRVVFLTKEAEDLIKELWTEKQHRRISRRGPGHKREEIWKTGRELYLISSAGKRQGNFPNRKASDKNPLDDDRLFPIAVSTIADVLTEAIMRAGYIEKTKGGMNKLHIHSTRKFFRTQFGQAAGPDAAETIMGHSPGLTANYRLMEEGPLAVVFQKHQRSLAVFRDKESDEIRDRVDRQADQHLAIIREKEKMQAEQNDRINSLEDTMKKMIKKLTLGKFVDLAEVQSP